MDKEKRIIIIAIVAAIALGVSLNIANSKRQSTNTNAAQNNLITPTEASDGQDPASQDPTTSSAKNTDSQTPTTLTQTLSLTLTSPANRTTVSTSTITVSGKTSANAEVFINDKTVKADSSGNFSTSLTLDEGENIIAVSANDANGNFVEKEITITYQP